MSQQGARLATCRIDGTSAWGLVRDDGFVNLGARLEDRYRSLKDVVEADALQAVVDSGLKVAADFPLSALTYLPPVSLPQKIICIGVNYPDRNEEYKDGQNAATYPSIFLRFPGSFVGHGQNLVRPPESEQLDYEGEVTLVIGKAGRRIERAQAFDHIAAVTLCNEGTLRDWLRHSRFNVTQGKNFDRSGSLGPWIVPFSGEAQIADIRLTTRVNGEVRQDDRTSRMIYDFRYLISYVSTFTTLVPGDLIVTGTPTGAGARFSPPIWLKPGDVVEVEAEGIGLLRNGIEDETI
ncbi:MULTISPECIES: fumarylacetoacetate hydrolase family protein [unclassified Beijerinckia]|uniref:fumarylacetoacetate hydrolase family protein n=1 Tax=unclassified Beijerinckia TaxID=2638183 RepID=UPI00089589AE|nr:MULTISPECIES: fumarylacetoacetate hydrolase family protein [unclassified Beijerinckia]MDH7794383.1 2-keto-4-pentenoate hydratase/2-oxohepta-3-ene-1,7-dioic acid hydratase in catechol pathway [Beijerinckia sp. GAS462]SEB60570.1 2-keto-4-pentenoate hydratase/2-oxohepta-3-ene-1,7-dioic acid hydratase (catechol pathway) [Beijerinckia sp. 28-YEA-48]